MTIAGLVGGVGPESTIDYYRRILEKWSRARPDSAPSIVIDSLDVTLIFRSSIRRRCMWMPSSRGCNRKVVARFYSVLMMNPGTSPSSMYRFFTAPGSEPRRRTLPRHDARPHLQRIVQMSSSPSIVE